MRIKQTFEIQNLELFKKQVMEWGKQFTYFVFLDSNQYSQDPYHRFECLIAGSLEEANTLNYKSNGSTKNNPLQELSAWHQEKEDWLFGLLGYDLKNSVEDLSSSNMDMVGMPDLFFFQPDFVICVLDKTHIRIETLVSSALFPVNILSAIEETDTSYSSIYDILPPDPPSMQTRMTYEYYSKQIKKIKEHILRGDIYEANFCQEFYATNTPLQAERIFLQLNKKAAAPFSAFFRLDHYYMLCASPERFLQKRGNLLISQPIKGTIERDVELEEDQRLQEVLKLSAKDRSENVMIVDLVRNDLARIAEIGSVKVKELFGVYSFETVHHLISTIQATLKEGVDLAAILEATFPMGSMTGAPKIRAMQLMEGFELSRRGIYSGSVGYITPTADFDFNVVIRSVLYNAVSQYLSLQVGGAITSESVAKQEYEECLMKVAGLLKGLRGEV